MSELEVEEVLEDVRLECARSVKETFLHDFINPLLDIEVKFTIHSAGLALLNLLMLSSMETVISLPFKHVKGMRIQRPLELGKT